VRDLVTPIHADYDHDGIVGFLDFSQFAAAFESTDATFDHDGDGFVGFSDFEIFISQFGQAPGPSGRDTIPFLEPIPNTP
jgi:hypothetical protein